MCYQHHYHHCCGAPSPIPLPMGKNDFLPFHAKTFCFFVSPFGSHGYFFTQTKNTFALFCISGCFRPFGTLFRHWSKKILLHWSLHDVFFQPCIFCVDLLAQVPGFDADKGPCLKSIFWKSSSEISIFASVEGKVEECTGVAAKRTNYVCCSGIPEWTGML